MLEDGKIIPDVWKLEKITINYSMLKISSIFTKYYKGRYMISENVIKDFLFRYFYDIVDNSTIDNKFSLSINYLKLSIVDKTIYKIIPVYFYIRLKKKVSDKSLFKFSVKIYSLKSSEDLIIIIDKYIKNKGRTIDRYFVDFSFNIRTILDKYNIINILKNIDLNNFEDSHFIRDSSYKPSEIFEFVGQGVKTWNGKIVNMNSDRYKVFKQSLVCVKCGISGTIFHLERDKHLKSGNPNKFHFNLYAHDKDGNEILMTKDHIFPVSLGGKSNMKNYQTM